jgi:hypothetical protein
MSDEVIPDENTKQVNRGKCGIVMPISPTEGYPFEHWPEVLAILKAVATDSGFDPNLVSDANDVGIIQKRIIQNLYSNEIVICDVSSKNPNVMFELGIRLAFDKPTIIIKDEQTDYSFDTAPIEHLTYPKDLNYSKILKFRIDLKDKLLGTWTKFKDDPNASTFLKAFGPFHVATLDTKEVSTNQLILEEIRELRTELAAMHRSQQPDLSINLSDVKMFRQPGVKDAATQALWEGMRTFREEELMNELRQMRPDWLPVKKTAPDLEQEHTKSNDESKLGGL